MTGPVAVETITSLDRAASLEHDWDALFIRAEGVTPFQSASWLLPWYAVWGPDRVHLLVARNGDGSPIGIVPAVRSHGQIEFAGGGVSD
jgi:hypothetical protein